MDLKKAYDRLKWSFIQDLLEDMQLLWLVVEVIVLCVSSCSLSILWNREQTEWLTPSRGIRQEDLL